MIRIVAAAAIAALSAAPALADGWSSSALEDGFDQQTCLDRARVVFNRYAASNNIQPDVVESGWSVAAYNILGPGLDSQFLCRTEGGTDPAYLITHSTGDADSSRSEIHADLVELWNAPK
jgi:hypothetical protein